MNVLVTGIDGFVGSHLAELLLADKQYVLFGSYRDKHPSAVSHQRRDIRYIQADITVREDVDRLIHSSHPSKVFHIAGQAFVPKSFQQPLETFQTNIAGTLNILESVRQMSMEGKFSPSVLVVSSGEVYGAVKPNQLPIDEQAPIQPMNPYAVSKACADFIGQQYRAAFGLNVIVARPFNHLGPGQSDAFVGSAFAKQFAAMALGQRERKLFVGNLDPERDFTDVRDVVQAYKKLLEVPHNDCVYNICSGHAVSIKHIVDELSDISGFTVEIIPDATKKRLNEVPKIIGTAAKLESVTGWKPLIPLRATLTDLVLYWKDRLGASA